MTVKLEETQEVLKYGASAVISQLISPEMWVGMFRNVTWFSFDEKTYKKNNENFKGGLKYMIFLRLTSTYIPGMLKTLKGGLSFRT